MDNDETMLLGDLPTMATLNSLLAPADMVAGDPECLEILDGLSP
jgi:hypothetical protein